MYSINGNKPHVAIIEPVGGHGGMDYYDFGLAKGLENAGFHISLYTCRETKLPLTPVPFKIYRFFWAIYGRTPKIIRAIYFLLGLAISLVHARARGNKVLHFHFFEASILQLLCIAFSKILFMRTVVTVHDVESFSGGTSRKQARRIYRLSNMVIVHNEVSKRSLIDFTSLNTDKIFIIPHGNYIDGLSTEDGVVAREKLNIPQQVPILLFFGQIKEVKGLDILLRALPDVVSKFPSTILIVAGKLWKSDLEEYSNLIHQLGIEKNVRLDIRYIPNNEVPNYYAASDIVVLPYRKIYQSGVLLMAMSYGKAVLVSDIPGMLEIIRDGKNGFVFRTENPQHLSDRLFYALSNKGERDRIAECGFQTVLKKHGWEKIGKMTGDIYQSLVGS